MRDPTIRQELIDPFFQYRGLFSEMVTKGISEGTLKDVQPKTAARLILALALGLIIQALIDQHGEDWGRVTQECLQIMLMGMAES
jgi:hypothetical protein